MALVEACPRCEGSAIAVSDSQFLRPGNETECQPEKCLVENAIGWNFGDVVSAVKSKTQWLLLSLLYLAGLLSTPYDPTGILWDVTHPKWLWGPIGNLWLLTFGVFVWLAGRWFESQSARTSSKPPVL